ncbi:hypothetical protein DPMN_111315 [Dreissena polymorpha]|uniref:Uncharacterized protein n=1 Tax=Dreissena polymorpha TaxID=45954 RepID=A0A9D4KEN6_DREPO|nr:hypothetical protein DPMN_111315 [Dreissena polymorpha]
MNKSYLSGETIDVTVHEVCANNKLKEIHKAGGGDWGGTMVDEAFIEFLTKIAGSFKQHLF